MRLGVDLSILNQKGTPAFYSDIFANRPTYGFAGRVFISTDTGAIYEDTGTSWTLIADAGAGTTGTLQQVTTNGNTTTQGITISAGGLTTNSLNDTALTTGSVLFSGASGLVTQDNTNLFWDNTNKYLGIGNTGGPTAPLDIHNGTVGQFIQLNATSTNNSNIAFLNGGVSKWRIGNVYNAGANNFNIYDATSGLTRFSLSNTGQLSITGYETISNTPTFASSGNYAINPSLILTIPASSTFNSGASYSGMATSLLNSWDGSNTIGNGAVMAGFIGVNRQTFNAAGYTVTLTQGSNGVRAVCGMQVLQQTGGLYNGTISHGASLLIQGVYPTGSATVTYTNYYGLLINQLDEYGLVTFTNRWGIYQGGSTDKNYFNGNVLLGSTTDNGSKLQVTGAATFSSSVQTTDLRYSGTGYLTYDASNTGTGTFSIRTGGGYTPLTLSNTGAATFSSSVTVGASSIFNGRTTNGQAFSCGNGVDSDMGIYVQTGNIAFVNTGGASGISFSLGGTTRLSIVSSGVVAISNLAGTGSRAVLADASGNLSAPVSDISVKENIIPIGYGLNEILKMKPVWFDFIDEYKNYGEGRQNGNIAQDIKEIIPEAVFKTPNTGKMGINYDQLHAIYIKAIQELNEKLVKNNIN